VARSQAKRAGHVAEITHFDCHCGSIECLGNAMDMGAVRRFNAGR